MPKEIPLQRQIVDWVNTNGGFVWRTNNGQFPIGSGNEVRWFKCGITGGSDIQGIWKNGKGLFIEVKTGNKTNKKNQPRDNQTAFLEAIKIRKGIAIVAYSLNNVVEVLEKILK